MEQWRLVGRSARAPAWTGMRARARVWAGVLGLAGVLAAGPAAHAGALEEARAHVDARRFPEAEPLLAAEARRTPDVAEVHFLLGRVAITHHQDAETAIGHFERAVALDGKVARYHLGLGGALGMKAAQAGLFGAMGLVPRVKAELERAVQLDPGSVDARLGLAQFYAMAPGFVGGSLERAREQALAVVRLDPVRGGWLLGFIHAHRKEDREAEARYREALAVPGTSEHKGMVHAALAALLARGKRAAEALAELQKYVALQPDRAPSHEALGGFYVEREEWALAAPHLERALALEPTYAPALFKLAQARAALGQRQEARLLYRRFLAVQPRGKQADEARRRLASLG